MAKRWSEVVASDAFKALSDSDKEAARKQYFNEVVAPRLSPDDLGAARAQFDQETGPRQVPAPAGGGELGWGDVASKAAQNFVPSAGQFLSDMAQPISHPITTAENLGAVGAGLAAKAGIGDADQGAADSVGQFFADRYGGMDNLKKTMAEDPVGFLSDISTVLTAGGSLAARAPGMLGKVADVAKTAGAITDPLSVPGAVAGQAASGLTTAMRAVLGLSTGTGEDAIRLMQEAGREGHAGALATMRGELPLEDVSDYARAGVKDMRAERGTQYTSDIAPISADRQLLTFGNIDKALVDARKFSHIDRNGVSFVKNPDAAKKLDDVNNVISVFKALPPTDFHTPGGFDGLKQALGDIRHQTEAGTPARAIIDQIYNAVRDEIVSANPDYARATLSYGTRTEQLRQIEKTFALRQGNTPDQSVRALTSAARNNVSTGYSVRQNLLSELARFAPELPAMMAGTHFQSFAPRGIARALVGGATGAYAWANPVTAPYAALAALASSPRLVGEGAYAVGQAQRLGDRLGGLITPTQRRLLRQFSYQSGRVNERAPHKD